MQRVRIEAIPAVRSYCAQLGTYAAEGERAVRETKNAIEAILERHDQVRGSRRIRRDKDDDELRVVNMSLRQCGEDQQAEIAELQARAEELRRQIQHHEDAEQELKVGFEQFNMSNSNFGFESGNAAGVMLDGEHEGAQLNAALNDMPRYTQQ